MATTIGSHTIATFTSPVNGTTPIDANTVRGNDNVIQTAYNAHDTDPGIHVQSSSLASRPVAGTAGRKWITEDSGVYTLWFDDGTNWHPVSSENIALTVLAGENLVKGDVVKVTGWNNGQDLPEVVKTTSAADTAFAVITATVSSGSMGYATNTGIVQDVNTAAYSVGTILYANGSGGFTSTKPTSGHYQPVAYVLRSNTNNGVYYVEFSTPRIVESSANTASTVVLRDGSGNFAAGTITATLSGTATQVSNALTAGTYLTSGGTYNGSAARTFAVDATDANTASKVVARDASGNFSAGTITATFSGNLTGNVTGNVSGSSGSTTGNAATATALQTARTINGVSFNGTADITVTAAAGTLSGNTLASGVTASSLTSVGTLSSLTVSGDLTVDTSTLKVDSANNRVGIKQATPLHPLHVGTTDLILDTSGNLGLGVTPSAWSVLTPALQFGGGGAFIAAQTTTPALYTGMNAHFNGTSWVYKVDGTATYVLQFNGAHSWFTAASGLAGNTITFTERVRVDGTTTAGETALLLWDVDNGALERVTVGAADSGGVGYKVLRIPN